MTYPLSKLTLLLLGIAVTATTTWADVDLQGLVTRSPFGEGKTGAGGQRTGSLEFRGYYVDNGITYFSIYNPSSKSSVWVAQGETSTTPFAVSVKNFDPEKNAVTLESNGQSMNLSLHESVIVKMELPAIPTTAQANNGVTPAAATAVVGSGTAGQAPTAEQAQSFKDSMRQRWQDRQNQNNGNDNNKNKGNNKAADTATSTENTTANSNQKNKGKNKTN
jgi:hypothetical protein